MGFNVTRPNHIFKRNECREASVAKEKERGREERKKRKGERGGKKETHGVQLH